MGKYSYKYNGAIPDNILIVLGAFVLVIAVAVIGIMAPGLQQQQVRARLQQLTARPTATLEVFLPPPTRTPRPSPPPSAAPTSTLAPEVVAERVALVLQQVEAPWSKGAWSEVIQLLEPAHGIAPQNITVTQKLYTAHYTYGQALRALGDKAGAIEQFSDALELVPTSAEAKTALYALVTPTPTYAPPPPPVILFTPPGRRPPAPTPRRR